MKRYINLLPPEEQKQIALLSKQGLVLRYCGALLISFAAFAAALFGAQFLLAEQLQSVEADLAARTQALHQLETAKVRGEVENFNRDLKNFTIMEKTQDHWSAIFGELAGVLPAGMTIDSIHVVPEGAAIKVAVAGRGGNRAAVLRLRENILLSELFFGVNFPLKNLERPQDTPWTYRFYAKQ